MTKEGHADMCNQRIHLKVKSQFQQLNTNGCAQYTVYSQPLAVGISTCKTCKTLRQ